MLTVYCHLCDLERWCFCRMCQLTASVICMVGIVWCVLSSGGCVRVCEHGGAALVSSPLSSFWVPSNRRLYAGLDKSWWIAPGNPPRLLSSSCSNVDQIVQTSLLVALFHVVALGGPSSSVFHHRHRIQCKLSACHPPLWSLGPAHVSSDVGLHPPRY